MRAASRVAQVGLVFGLGVLISGVMVPSAAQEAPGPDGKLKDYTLTLPNSAVKLKMLPVPAGSIKIKNKTVAIKPLWMAETEIPWEVYDVFLASGEPSPAYDQTDFPPDAIARPSKSYILPDLGWGHNGYPAINVSSLSVDMFCRWLSSATGKKYRLPTEAEWEYACRAGAVGPVKLTKAQADKVAWYQLNAQKTTQLIRKKAPNKWGFYDMYGNPGEWATDLDGKFVLCGGTFLDGLNGMIPGMRRYFQPRWQETDPQFPKSRWWLADGKFCGFRIVCEP